MSDCAHRPGRALVEDHRDEQRATCTGCGQVVARLLTGGEDRAPRWSSWRPPAVPVVV